jgi:hypothetical protein
VEFFKERKGATIMDKDKEWATSFLRSLGIIDNPPDLQVAGDTLRAELAKAGIQRRVFVPGCGPGDLIMSTNDPLTYKYADHGMLQYFWFDSDLPEEWPKVGDYLVWSPPKLGQFLAFKVTHVQDITSWKIEGCSKMVGRQGDEGWKLVLDDNPSKQPWWIRIPKAAVAPFIWTTCGAWACAVEPRLRSDLLGITLLFTPVALLLGYITYFDNPTAGILTACLGFAPHVLWAIVEGFRRRDS